MATLKALLGAESMRPKVVEDCVALIDAQVKTKGFVVKAAYATIKTIKRRFVPEVVNSLLDEWLDKVQPHHDRWAAQKGTTFADYMIARSDEVAEDLLSVTDARAQNTKHTRAKKMYEKMRPAAKKDVMDAIPELARTIERRLAEASAPTPTPVATTTTA